MTALDMGIIAVYLLALMGWAVYSGLHETADDYLVFSRRAPFWLVLFSIVATWVGTGTTLAVSASTYKQGISLGLTAACSVLVGAFVGAWFAPKLQQFGDRFNAHTIGDLFDKRYSRVNQGLVSVVIVFIYVTLTAAQFVGLMSLVRVWPMAGMEFFVWIAVASTILYTAFSGIKSDFYTDVIHFVLIILIFAFVLTPSVLSAIGGIQTLAVLPESYFDPFAYGGVSFFVIGIIFGAGSTFVSMELWQRIYASSSGTTARRALFLSMCVTALFYGMSTLFGLSARFLYPNLSDKDVVFFVVMNEHLPSGWRGLGLAAFMAVVISTLNSTIMVASASVTKDIYKGFIRKQATGSELLLAGRIATLLCGMAGLGIALWIHDIVALSVNGTLMLLILLPAIGGGFFWRRATSFGSLLSIIIGIIVLSVFMWIDAATAFLPGFMASLISFVLGSYLSQHAPSENLSLVRFWSCHGKP
ncbi:MAG: sodium:solute symporter family protein [Magnetococcales bacterium]|nr:sodium:solute symporter family protein [Magnetococcales bacterium]